jgi:hypothetical protein
MRALVITNEVREGIAKVVKCAWEAKIPFAEMEARANDKKGRYRPIGDDPGRTISIPMGFKVTFSIEEQPQPIGWVRHISVSIEARDQSKPLPSLAAVGQLMLEFGFNPLNQKKDLVYLEELKGGECDGLQAVNILQQITPANPNATVTTSTQPPQR